MDLKHYHKKGTSAPLEYLNIYQFLKNKQENSEASTRMMEVYVKVDYDAFVSLLPLTSKQPQPLGLFIMSTISIDKNSIT